MKRERMSRREFLRRGLVGLSAVALGKRVRPAGDAVKSGRAYPASRQASASLEHQSTAAVSRRPSLSSPVEPLALSAHEFATVAAIASVIVPTDGDPGAKEANVAGYIDRLVSQSAEKRVQYVDGVRWIDTASAKLFGREKRFLDLSLEQQTDLLRTAEETLEMRLRPVPTLWTRVWRKLQKTYDDLFGLGEGARFFRFVREDTLAGFYTNPISWNMLGYIGPPQPRGYPHYEDCPPQARR